MERIQLDDDSNIEVISKDESIIYRFLKRFLDVVLSIIGLVILSPVLLIVSILIKLESKGAVFYAHKRLGKNREYINLYKFRSMHENSREIFERFTEEQKKEYYKNFKLENDPRVTKIGDFIRKTSIDELPQLVNVIKGDMSLVGPRPIVEEEVMKYGEYADKFFSVIPGITGYWQANGRSDTSYEERVQMDMYYIDNKSLMMDIKIVFSTAISVIKKEGAV